MRGFGTTGTDYAKKFLENLCIIQCEKFLMGIIDSSLSAHHGKTGAVARDDMGIICDRDRM
ncbi:MAG: hypothetical protein A3F67_07620 [Verrucomicrobia bacterium RIFCSPHIGHO2_12_FULL_41_10]|nr:MAG: hypothetical protein A3F67_07620 [Verrucomicrobia bacterium RIFCSPHIGHO2_12_FULL_41_10]